MTRASEETNRRLLRARDAMDRSYPEVLDIAALAAISFMSKAHFIRSFRAAFGRTPHCYRSDAVSNAPCTCSAVRVAGIGRDVLS